MTREAFDPSHYVQLARTQHPGHPWLAEQLAACTTVWRKSRAYVYCTKPETDPVQVVDCFILEDRKQGAIVVDVLRGCRVSGLEFLGLL